MRSVRRPLLVVALSTVTLLFSAACGAGPGTSAAPAAGWSFTDDLGHTITLDAAPERIAAINDVASSLWNYGIEPLATFGQTPASEDPAFEGRDLSGVVQLGASYGEIDLEQLAANRPDVVVTIVYPVDRAGTVDESQPLYGFESVEQQEQIGQIAPVITIVWRGSAADVAERTTDLAVALGADPEAIEQDRHEFDAAAEQLTEAAAAGLTVLPVAAYPDEGFYMAKASDEPALHLYQDLGVQFIDPGGSEFYWRIAGWESVPEYRSDVLLYSVLGGLTPAEMEEQPTYRLLPAAQADQVHEWKNPGMDYVALASCMRELAGWLDESQKVT